ncbi:MAG: SRPBCC family protein [Deltaproteobacteria bacterium]|nr:SRPBCC family protein [Deltaproteobacteria bacterium]
MRSWPLALWLAVTLFGVEARADRGFSAGEMSALGSGRLVARPMRNARSSLVGGTSWIVVDADWRTVWRALTDFPAYTRIFPRTTSSRLVQRSGQVRIVAMSQGNSVVRVDYALRAVLAPAKREITFRVDRRRPHGLRDGWGFFNLEPKEGGKTLVSYGVVVDPGSPVVQGLFSRSMREQLLGVPKRLKRWIEGTGASRYRG